MRVLADENFPGGAVAAMRQAGHNVLWIRESYPGIKDEKVLELAGSEGRILVTFDKDFGELAFKTKLPATCGIVLFRIRLQSPGMVARRATDILASRDDWAGHFSVVEEARLRMTDLPR